ncbi:MAG: hypothetical protein ACYDGM_11700 [Vulcanimicrobiaceae bacterium]
MMEREPVRARTDLIIWGSSGLLAAVLGLGSAFVLWMALRESAQMQAVSAGIVALGLGLILIGFSTTRALPRAFLIVFAVALVAGFVLGSPGFAHLTA